MTGISREHNLSTAAAVRTLGESQDFYDTARFRYVEIEHNGSWMNAITVGHVFLKGQAPAPTDEQSYPRVRLKEVWCSTDKLISQLRNDQITLPDRTIEIAKNRNWERAFFASESPFGRHPGHLYRVRWQDASIHISQEIVLAHKRPYFPDIASAIRDWTSLETFSELDTRSGQLLLFIPEGRAYFEKMVRDGAKVLITARIDDSAIKELRLQGGWTRAGRFENFDVPVPDSGESFRLVELELPDRVEKLDAYLIGPNNTLYDYHREALGSCEGLSRVLGPDQSASDEAAVLQAINRGEGREIEFKKFVKFEHDKINEVVRTIVALANTSGGIVIIGVDNNCEVVGVEADLITRYRDDRPGLSDACTRYIGELRQTINGRMDPTLDLTMRPVTVAGHTVILIRATEGSAKPYKEIPGNHRYVRRGANNVEPNDDELRELCKSWVQPTAQWG